jgi:hypothetical protein
MKSPLLALAILVTALTSTALADEPTVKDVLPAGNYTLIQSTARPASDIPDLFSSPATITYRDDAPFIKLKWRDEPVAIHYRNGGVLLVLPPSDNPKWAFAATVLSGSARTDSESHPMKGQISGRVTTIMGWSDKPTEGYFSLTLDKD